jgi:predicted nucleotidyltransferase/DNA-binding transcriptional ArsR family regulator
MRLISSDLALEAAVALSASVGLPLSQLARAIGVLPSAAQRALEILLEDGVVERVREERLVYRLRSTETADHVVALAAGEIPLARAVTIGARANPAIEFVARESRTLVTVLSANSTALTQARAARFLETVASRHGLEVKYLDHDDVRRALLAEPQLRARIARAERLHGDLDRTFPDRSRHWGPRGRLLHRAHKSLRLPSRNAIRSLARQHQLDSLKLFGSGVRSDFRQDSDVDVLVRYRSGVRPSLRSLIQLERALESAFGRDVDLVREDNLLSDLRERVEREAVPLL